MITSSIDNAERPSRLIQSLFLMRRNIHLFSTSEDAFPNNPITLALLYNDFL